MEFSYKDECDYKLFLFMFSCGVDERAIAGLNVVGLSRQA